MKHLFKRIRQPLSYRRLLLITLGYTVCVLLICSVLIVVSGRRIADRYIRDVGEETLKYYQSTLDHSLSSIDDYCETVFGNNIATSMYQTKDSLTRKALQEDIGQSLSNLTQVNNAYFTAIIPADSIEGEGIIRSQCGSMAESNAIYSALQQIVRTEPGIGAYTSWRWYSLCGEDYLTKITKYHDSYCAVALDTQIFYNLAGDENNFYLFCVDDSKYVSGSSPIQTALTEQKIVGDTLRVKGKQFMVLTVPAQSGDFTIGMLLTTSVATILQDLLYAGVILMVLLIGMFALFSVLFRRLSTFFSTLNNACVQIASGDLNTQIAQRGQLEEEDRLYQTFNDMTQQIKELRINLYEQELSAQRSKTQFLQIQIKSHFFLNCLNTIHSLAMVGDTPLIQEFSLCLSDYFRYLGSGFSDTVRFGSELVHLQNYIKLNQIRYPDRIRCTFSIDPQVETQQILPMLPQTFVENIFKHALGSSNVINIHIQAYSAEIQDGMYLIIQDDGPGFSTEMLQQLNDPSRDIQIPAGTGPGTGIQNTKARMGLFYGGRASVRFENAQDHGAIVRLYFPNPE